MRHLPLSLWSVAPGVIASAMVKFPSLVGLNGYSGTHRERGAQAARRLSAALNLSDRPVIRAKFPRSRRSAPSLSELLWVYFANWEDNLGATPIHTLYIACQRRPLPEAWNEALLSAATHGHGQRDPAGQRGACAFPQVGLAPAMPYGTSGEHRECPGTLSIGTDAPTAVLVRPARVIDLAAGAGDQTTAMAETPRRVAGTMRVIRRAVPLRGPYLCPFGGEAEDAGRLASLTSNGRRSSVRGLDKQPAGTALSVCYLRTRPENPRT